MRQKISSSVLEDTVKLNSSNLLTSLFLKIKIKIKILKNCKLPSVMQWQCCDSLHTVYFMFKDSKSEHFHLWFVKLLKKNQTNSL